MAICLMINTYHFHRGVLPFEQRKKLLEKARARARRNRTTFTSCIVRGVQVMQSLVQPLMQYVFAHYTLGN